MNGPDPMVSVDPLALGPRRQSRQHKPRKRRNEKKRFPQGAGVVAAWGPRGAHWLINWLVVWLPFLAFSHILGC